MWYYNNVGFDNLKAKTGTITADVEVDYKKQHFFKIKK